MKMLSCGLIWGLLIVLFGLSIILKSVFGISIPFIRILLGLLIIYAGIRIMTGGWSSTFSYKDQDTVVMGASDLSFTEGRTDYSIVFGTGTIDLRDAAAKSDFGTIEANIIFGDGRILIPKDKPVIVELSAAFGKTSLYDKSISGIGSTTWQSPEYKADSAHIRIKANAVFGKARVETGKPRK
jgi:predicted membrane protein